MADNTKRYDALARFGKVLAAGALASAIAWVAGPDFANVVGTTNAVLLAAVLTPILSAAEKVFVPVTS